MKKIIPLVITILLSTAPIKAQKLTTENIPQVVKGLTLEEKINIVVGVGFYFPGITPESAKIKDKIPGAAGHSFAIDRIGLPQIVLADGPAGIRITPERPGDDKKYYATAFPIATLMASTWDLDLMKKVGEAFGEEAKEYGVDILLAPALNIHRNPLTGRNFEYYSEDPLLAGKMAAAFVKGVQEQGVGTSIKHFAANNQETNRITVNAVISERAMREIYLKGFEIAVKEAEPWTVMSAYNRINGVYASQRHDLLTDILRNEWNYDGFVMTDWFAGNSAVEQMKAGNDLLMPGIEKQREDIRKAIADGSLSMETLNQNVERILNIYTKTLSFKGYEPDGEPELKKHRELARKAATQGMVLLKNENQALPIQKTQKIALFGNASYDTFIGGTGSGDVNNIGDVTIIEGFKTNEISFDEELANVYQSYIKDEKAKLPPKEFAMVPDQMIDERTWTTEQLNSIADRNDVAIFTLGRSSGEFMDRSYENDYLLTEKELNAIKQLSKVFHDKEKKFIVLLNIGGVIETDSWKELADAILITWQPGQEAGNAVYDIVSGEVSPSGKLPMTFPVKISDHLSSENFPGKEYDLPMEGNISFMMARPAEVHYEEGIFVGYRHFETADVNTSFPFGYGQSYTSFEYKDLNVTENSGSFEISMTVENTGKMAAKEVVQLYVSAPESNLPKPIRELKGFLKTKTLSPGETQTLTFSISVDDLASYHTDRSAWITEAGEYTFQVGASVSDIKLVETANVPSEIIVSDVENQLKNIEMNLEEKEKEGSK
ncbi:glycoside hydrolase family 3 C-terminal domain-containing protein [Mangrovivirga sp. M17]|uniref:Glycoside hydrolase family 3 C-terminal domain-containing protein n=1 Tax=Mangrovivirga halotolerans TaxID=2993936 RepID=A0ABT3RV42_9BACT|nr:glycoside hydrolase family 3 N-terminal domain-containing protein [Mangrovivirga halotolerans]MCX2745452.1 glycoside hydrolase family 3 C-terminal domain-containing protein [Mangrovivirga halotolerans]